MSQSNSHLSWITGYKSRKAGFAPNTYVAEYLLTDLIQKGHINRRTGQTFLLKAGLTDFHWEITWQDDTQTPDANLIEHIDKVDGYVVWVHGWTGNMHIWEELPVKAVVAKPQLVSIAIDHNGFGLSPFENQTPALDLCDPQAAMRTLQSFIDLIGIRQQTPGTPPKVINLVGHSMGGATLFFLDSQQWQQGEVTRFAVAPALLAEDETHKAFYSALGVGINLVHDFELLEAFEKILTPRILETLAAGASSLVVALHDKQYKATPRGVTAATISAMGRVDRKTVQKIDKSSFKMMRVMLGHRDPLVDLTSMIDFLGTIKFPAPNIHVVPGTHYMFSVRDDEDSLSSYHHEQARDMLLKDVLGLHEQASITRKA